MSPAQWTAVQSLFQRALDLSPEQREEFLQSASFDPEIQREVESLLLSVKEDEFLNSPALESARGTIETGRSTRGRAYPAPVPSSSAPSRGTATGSCRCWRAVHMELVFLATDSRLADRKVVVKVLDAAAEHQRWLQRRFQQEIEILGRISHPAVAGIRDCGELHGQPYLVMDFIDGVTLRERMKSALIPRNVASIVAQIGSALRAAHIQGIIHRDLKPENIMIQPAPEDGAAEARVKLIDFGIAHMQRAEVGGTTTVLMIAGTARYMAPEQFLGDRRCHERYLRLGGGMFRNAGGRHALHGVRSPKAGERPAQHAAGIHPRSKRQNTRLRPAITGFRSGCGPGAAPFRCRGFRQRAAGCPAAAASRLDFAYAPSLLCATYTAGYWRSRS